MDRETLVRSSRRHFLAQQSVGIGSLALAWLLNQDEVRAEGAAKTVPPKKPTLEKPTFDLKPELTKRHLQKFSGDIKYDNAAEASAKLLASPWKFSKHGECGMELSE